jgi:hypothetical protein
MNLILGLFELADDAWYTLPGIITFLAHRV